MIRSAPKYEDLPAASSRRSRRGSATCELSARIEVVTPILGGAAQTRALDDLDVIRAPTVRGHLRFWWRALNAANYAKPEDLYHRESQIWGRAAGDAGGRSLVEVRIEVERAADSDDSDIDLQPTSGAYALWPARAEKKHGQITKLAAPRRKPGTRFRLVLVAPADLDVEIRNVLRAWLLFGGYGSRTRRGLGSFKVLGDASAWQPPQPTREAITAVFGVDVFASAQTPVCDVPRLAGAALHVGTADRDAVQAWTTALNWLKEFRQGTRGKPGDRAREPDPRGSNRSSVSNWPEADKIRHLKGKTQAHPPRHNANPVWPRAGFGLPIIGQFQTHARDGGRYDEPGPYELRWRGDREHDRLASPLIVKALPLADGSYVPCALWLARTYPKGEVLLKGTANATAPFDRLVAPGDTPRFSALANKHSLREAFLDWLQAKYQTTVIAP
ncbi:MAG TPA: type III-B CRISPR module RAMP protein Cmr1 [Hyphomicrobiaceae bacterium]|nr:type III-B CRISPR module RAMP protein Cmr1 [Hyphomicrobiaceae bacterium]